MKKIKEEFEGLDKKEKQKMAKGGEIPSHLTIGQLTSGINGYPTPYVGDLVYGFYSFEEAQDFAKENNGEVIQAHQRDGWHVWEDKGNQYEPFDIHKMIDDGRQSVIHIDADDYKAIKEKDYDRMAYLDGYDSFKDYVESFGFDIKDKEDVEKAKEQLEDYFKGYEEGYNIRDNVNEYIEQTFDSDELMEYSYDTHNYVVGVRLEPYYFNN